MLRVGAWLADFESELFAFPYIRHDNQCDSISQALNDEGVRRVPSMTKENLEEQCRLVALMPRGVGHSRGKDQPASCYQKSHKIARDFARLLLRKERVWWPEGAITRRPPLSCCPA